jgi:hypothetical protein
MPLAAGVLRKEYIARTKALRCAITESDIDVTGKRDDPTAARRPVEVYDMRREIVSKQQARCAPCGIEKFRLSAESNDSK